MSQRRYNMKSDKKCLIAIYGASSAGKDTVTSLFT